MKRAHWLAACGLVLAAIVISLAVYSSLPDVVPVHWNIRGEADGWGPKAMAAFLFPGIMIPLLGLFRILPWLSPKQFELDSFRSTYGWIIVLVMGLFLYIHVLSLLPGLGYPVQITRAIVGGMMLFFIFLGNLLGKVQRNFFVGIRTPWTLASERVWADTHRVGAWAFVATGVIGFLAMMADASPLVPIGLILVSSLSTVVYSLVRYKQLERRGQL